MMSQSIGPFCDLNQDITSSNASEGAAVALELLEYERESKRSYFSLNSCKNIKISTWSESRID